MYADGKRIKIVIIDNNYNGRELELVKPDVCDLELLSVSGNSERIVQAPVMLATPVTEDSNDCVMLGDVVMIGNKLSDNLRKSHDMFSDCYLNNNCSVNNNVITLNVMS